MFEGEADEVRARAQSQLLADVRPVGFDGLLADVQFAGDLGRGVAQGDERAGLRARGR